MIKLIEREYFQSSPFDRAIIEQCIRNKFFADTSYCCEARVGVYRVFLPPLNTENLTFHILFIISNIYQVCVCFSIILQAYSLMKIYEEANIRI